MNTRFFESEINRFLETGRLVVANKEEQARYEAALKKRGIPFRAVGGLGQDGVETIICSPENEEAVISTLLREIEDTIGVLRRRLSAWEATG